MSDAPEQDRDPEQKLVLEYDLDAPPEKVLRAVTIPALRERWLPGADLAEDEPVVSDTGDEVRYRMRGTEPPFPESNVTFRIQPNDSGGTRFSVIHRFADAASESRPARRLMLRAANTNRRTMMRAA